MIDVVQLEGHKKESSTQRRGKKTTVKYSSSLRCSYTSPRPPSLLLLSSLHICPAARRRSRPGTTARLLVKCWRLVPLGPRSHSWHPAARLGGPVPRCHSHTKQSGRRHHIMSVSLLRTPGALSIVWKPKNKQVNTTGGERWRRRRRVWRAGRSGRGAGVSQRLFHLSAGVTP